MPRRKIRRSRGYSKMRTRVMRVEVAIKDALKMLGIESNADPLQIYITANHRINVYDYDKNYVLCIPTNQNEKLCYRSKNHVAYTYSLSTCNKANNIARKGDIENATRLFKSAIDYFIRKSDMIYIERITGPKTIEIEVIRMDSR
jgi:hypothetical protein